MSQWTMMTEFTLSLPDRPGQLASFAARLRGGDIELLVLDVRALDIPQARLHCIPENVDEFRMFLRSTDLEYMERDVVLLREEAGAGSFTRTLEDIASAGINLHTLRGVTLDSGIGYIIRPHDQDMDAFLAFLENN